MQSDFDLRLNTLAEVICKIGVNLQPGQPLLVSDPYELQGVHPEALGLVDAIRSVAPGNVTAVPSDLARLRELVESDNLPGYETLVAGHIRVLIEHLSKGGAFLFLPGCHPGFFSGLPADRLSRFDAAKWRYLGPLVQSLLKGVTQWTLATAPTSAWAGVTFPHLPLAEQLPALWRTVFQAMRVEDSVGNGVVSPPEVVTSWQLHLSGLTRRRNELNAAKHRRIRYLGNGTDLTLQLPSSRVWRTAQLTSKRGLPFVVNLPTEEIFTAPHRRSAVGRVRIARPVVHAGALIEGIQLEFSAGRVRTASATTNSDLLQRLLATDDGADRIGEVALIPGSSQLTWADRVHHNILLDENAAPHIALGDAYRFCSRAWWPISINSSQIHLDLPLDAKVEFLA
jgi:aminopeptidase